MPLGTPTEQIFDTLDLVGRNRILIPKINLKEFEFFTEVERLDEMLKSQADCFIKMHERPATEISMNGNKVDLENLVIEWFKGRRTPHTTYMTMAVNQVWKGAERTSYDPQ